jgi:outer membrane protein assembly factor BamA
VAATWDIYRERHSSHLQLFVQGSGLELTRYYGPGNETARLGDGEPFKVDNSQYRVEAALAVPLGKGELRFGPALQFTHTSPDSGRFVTQTQPYGTGDFGQLGGRASISFDTRDHPGASRRGVQVLAAGSIFPGIWSVASTFGEVHGEASTFLGVKGPLQPVLALRVGGQKVWGDYPFFASAFLGGAEDLRGFDQQRFAGDAAAWGNAELRLRVGTVHVLLPATVGIHGLADVGRVWAPGETSDRWHHALGGGIWFSLDGPVSTISLSIAHSDERTGVYARAGFGF